MDKHIIPANPGFFVLEIFSADDENQIDVEKHEVIAWSIEIDYTPHPITYRHGECDLGEIMQFPDGRIQYGGAPWANMAKFIEQLKLEARLNAKNQ